MRHIILFAIVGLFMSLTSCRDDFEFEQSPGGLEFSRDTVYLDTVFSDIGSSTYTLKVYNRSDKDIAIPSLRLKKGQSSNYRMMVDGMSGKEFNNVELLAKDSLFIFIETTVNIAQANPDDFLYTDEIEFHSMNGVQEVHLVTLIQDAYFLFPQRNNEGLYEAVRFDSDDNPGEPTLIYGFNLDENDPENGNEYHWTNEKPYVIYGFATVPNGKTLVVDPGARVHFHAGSGLMVRPGGTLQVNGQQSSDEELMENEVIFEGDRLEPRFAQTAGQWGAVLLMSGTENTISHLTIKNSALGIWAKAPDGDGTTIPKLNIRESQIYNSGNYGILSVHANITAQNVVINNAGNASLGLLQGGTHNFTHCTIANYTNAYDQVPLLLSDYFETEETTFVSTLNATFTNCIFWGSGNLGLKHKKLEPNPAGTAYNYRFNNCLIKFFDFSNLYSTNSLYQFNDQVNYVDCRTAKNSSSPEAKVDFTDRVKNNFDLEDESSAIGIGTLTIATDIEGRNRDSAPDAGAYEYQN